MYYHSYACIAPPNYPTKNNYHEKSRLLIKPPSPPPATNLLNFFKKITGMLQ